MDFKDLINLIKYVGEKLQVFHHNTTSFPQHKSFGDIYDSFDSYKDDLIEKLMGYTNQRYVSTNIGEVTYTDTTGLELVKDLMNLGEILMEYADDNGYYDIENIGQEINGLGAKLNYLLTLKNVSEGKLFDILGDLAGGDAVEILSLVRSPKKYVKATVGRMILDKLNQKGIVGDKATKIIDVALKLYPAVFGSSNESSNYYEAKIQQIKSEQELLRKEKKSEKREKQLQDLESQVSELKVQEKEDEIKKLQVKIDAIKEEIQIEKDSEKIAKLKAEQDRLEAMKAKKEEIINSIKGLKDKAISELDSFLR